MFLYFAYLESSTEEESLLVWRWQVSSYPLTLLQTKQITHKDYILLLKKIYFRSFRLKQV